MALCTLLAKHREREGWPENVITYTIDHGVRQESGDEAKQVQKLMTNWGTGSEDPNNSDVVRIQRTNIDA